MLTLSEGDVTGHMSAHRHQLHIDAAPDLVRLRFTSNTFTRECVYASRAR